VSEGLFSPEALAHHAAGGAESDLLRYDRRWPRRVYALLLMAASVAFLFVSLFGIDEYANGPALVRVDGRRMITATAPATVASVEVQPAQAVEVGSVLVRMYNADEANELARATREFDLELVRMLRDPGDAQTKLALASLRAARDQARNIVDSRIVRADVRGHVSDVRVRKGQHVNAGEVLVALAPEGEAHVSVVAMVSAQYRPLLKNGARMRFELEGFRFEYADLVVNEVSTEAVGPAEVQRFLGQERGDAVALDPGAKVLVTARIPTTTFSSEGQVYGYFDGLIGSAAIRVRRQTILALLIPALKPWQLPARWLPRSFKL
jgi:membrane fusion protein (multidrug efflux system)